MITVKTEIYICLAFGISHLEGCILLHKHPHITYIVMFSPNMSNTFVFQSKYTHLQCYSHTHLAIYMIQAHRKIPI
jgi:hypothetical protein